MAPPSINLPPDPAVLMQARIEAGQRNLMVREIAHLLLYDPVLTLEFLQSANSAMYGGGPVIDLEAALTRLGSQKVIQELSDLNDRPAVEDEEVAEIHEVLRYNCRRVSILSLIVASALRPSLAAAARMTGLFADVGHMIALSNLGKKYCEILKTQNRKNLPFRLEKDHNLNLEKMRAAFLRSKGLPDRLLGAYDLEMTLKAANDIDLRFCVRSAIEIVEAYDSGKMSNFSPDKPLPARSDLRLLKITPVQQERLYKACSDYLKMVAADEAPAGASFLISPAEESNFVDLNSGGADSIRVPHYPIVSIKPKNRASMQAFFDLCESAESEVVLKGRAVEGLLKSPFFTRSALVRVPAQSDEAIVECSAGFDGDMKKTIPINDPLSPFNLFRLDIRSVNLKSVSPKAPFGVNAYAIGPIAMSPDGEKLLLYADAAGTQGLAMDARSGFRLAMSLLVSRFEALRNPA